MNRIKFSEKITINRKQEAIFDLTQDYDQRLLWDTFLKKAVLIDGAKQAAKGVKSYCVAQNGIGMETVYISFNRPKTVAIQMTKGPFLFDSFQGSWRFIPVGPSTTEVIFLYAFSLRFPFHLGAFWIKRLLRKEVKRRLSDLKAYLEP